MRFGVLRIASRSPSQARNGRRPLKWSTEFCRGYSAGSTVQIRGTRTGNLAESVKWSTEIECVILAGSGVPGSYC
jgi:hypothetical protein